MTPDALETENHKLKAELKGLRDILGSVGACVYTKDLESRYTYANSQTCELFGASFEDLIGTDGIRFFDNDIVASFQEIDRRVLDTGRTQVQEQKLVHQLTGETRIYVSVKAPLHNEEGQIVGICGVLTDITEQNRVKARLEETHRLLNTVLDTVEANIYMKDAEGKYLYVNRNVLETVHLTQEQMIGHTDIELFPVDVAQAYHAVDKRVFASGQTLRTQESFVDETGHKQYYWSTKLALKRSDEPDTLIGFSTNITALKNAEIAWARSETRFQQLFEASSEAIVLMDRTRFIDCNDSVLRLFGVPNKAKFLELTPADLSPPQQACGTPSEQKAAEVIDQAFKIGRHHFEWMIKRYDNGIQIPVDANVVAVEIDESPALLFTFRDLTERKRYEEQIHQLAFYDALTQLPNRRLLYDRLSQALTQHRRSSQHGCVIYLDLDNFKPLNDRHGHIAGDQLLQEVGRRLVACLRAQDTVARQGGDEFVVLLIELDESWDIAMNQATHVAEKILSELARPYTLTVEPNGGPAQVIQHRCTASLGIAMFRPSDSNLDNILRRADDAMYRAKAKGRNQICFGEAWVD